MHFSQATASMCAAESGRTHAGDPEAADEGELQTQGQRRGSWARTGDVPKA